MPKKTKLFIRRNNYQGCGEIFRERFSFFDPYTLSFITPLIFVLKRNRTKIGDARKGEKERKERGCGAEKEKIGLRKLPHIPDNYPELQLPYQESYSIELC